MNTEIDEPDRFYMGAPSFSRLASVEDVAYAALHSLPNPGLITPERFQEACEALRKRRLALGVEHYRKETRYRSDAPEPAKQTRQASELEKYQAAMAAKRNS